MKQFIRFALELGRGGRFSRFGDRWPLFVTLGTHLVLLLVFIPPSRLFDGVPLFNVDYSYHWHVAHVSHQSLRQGMLPWGYNPQTLPGQWIDLTSSHVVPYQCLGSLFGPTAAVKIMAFSGLLLAPLLVLGGCAAFGIRPVHRIWILLAVIVAIWTTSVNIYMYRSGLMAFFIASYVAFPTLGLFARYADAPSWGRLCGFIAAASVMFAFHSFSPLIIALPLIVLTVASPQLRIKWRVAAAASPLAIAAVNSFWLIPNVGYSMFGTRPEWFPNNPIIHKGIMIFNSWAEFVSFITQPPQLVGNAGALILAGFGVRLAVPATRRASRVGLLTAIVGLLIISWFGSFLGPLKVFQTHRFGMPFRLFLLSAAVPVCPAVLRRLRVPPDPVAALVSVAVAAFVVISNQVPRTPDVPYQSEMLEWIQSNTNVEDRIALQADWNELQGLAFAGYLNREIFSTCFPNVHDPAQFSTAHTELADTFVGRRLELWTPEDLHAAFDRVGISIVITKSEEWSRLVESFPASAIGVIGPYRMYRISPFGERFLVGRGQVQTSINRLMITDLVSEGGRVVLKYRYHPGWSSDGAEIVRYSTPDDKYGYIELRNPPTAVVLRFDPWRSLFVPWPQERE